MKKLVFAAMAAVGLSVFGADEMPDVTMLVSLNGGLSIRVAANDFTRNTAGISGGSATDFSRMTFEVQLKPAGADDSGYVGIAGAIPPYGVAYTEQTSKGEYFLWEASEKIDPGVYTVRARATAVAAGVTTEWKVLGDVTSFFHFSGTVLDPKVPVQAPIGNASDGKVSTFYEYWKDDASAVSWCGQDLGRPCLISRIRLVRRSGWRSRATGARFQVADNSLFTINVRTVYVCPAETEDFTVLNADLDEPVSARYVRVCTTGPQCCNFNEVEWGGEMLPMVEPVSMEDQTPVVKWTVFASEGVRMSQAEWSYREDGDYTPLGEATDGAGTFSMGNEAARVGLPIYYRIRRQLASGGEVVSSAVRYVRARQLEREPLDQSKLATGVVRIPCCGYSTDVPATISGVDSVGSLFDGDSETFAQVWYTIGTAWHSPELLLGVRFPEAAHIVSAYALPRNSTAPATVGRLGYMSILAAATEADYTATNTALLSAPVAIKSVDWHRYASLDIDTTFEYVFGYDGPLANGIHDDFFGNFAELRFYGWTAADEGACFKVAPPTIAPPSPTDTTPVATWTAPDLVLSSCLECAYQVEGPYWAADIERTGAGTFAFTNTAASVGLTLYYRIRYKSVVDDAETSTTPVAYTRLRNLNTTTFLNATQYDPDKGANWIIPVNNKSDKAFDGNETTWPDMMTKSYAAVNPVIGLSFETAAHVGECWALPRSTSLARMKSVDLFAAATTEDFEAGNKVRLAPAFGNALQDTWNRYVSTDATSLYTCAFLYSANKSGWCGNVAEVKFMGWTEADRRAAGAVGAPTDVAARPGFCEVTVSWGTAENAETIRIERRRAGEDDWTVVRDGVALMPSVYTDTGLEKRQTYEYRISGVGLQGRMIVPASVVTATTLPPGLMLMVR